MEEEGFSAILGEKAQPLPKQPAAQNALITNGWRPTAVGAAGDAFCARLAAGPAGYRGCAGVRTQLSALCGRKRSPVDLPERSSFKARSCKHPSPRSRLTARSSGLICLRLGAQSNASVRHSGRLFSGARQGGCCSGAELSPATGRTQSALPPRTSARTATRRR